MIKNPLLSIRQLGQSIWLDDIHRGMLKRGALAELVRQDGIASVTSNPSILEKAIIRHDDYQTEILNLGALGRSAVQLYEQVTLEDLRKAADLLRPVYDAAEGQDGVGINPATIYIAFRASGRRRNKAQCAGKGHSLAKHWNAGPVPA